MVTNVILQSMPAHSVYFPLHNQSKGFVILNHIKYSEYFLNFRGHLIVFHRFYLWTLVIFSLMYGLIPYHFPTNVFFFFMNTVASFCSIELWGRTNDTSGTKKVEKMWKSNQFPKGTRSDTLTMLTWYKQVLSSISLREIILNQETGDNKTGLTTIKMSPF